MVANIKFKFSIKDDCKKINHFVSPGKGDWDWSKYIFHFHPKLKIKLKNIKDKKERKKIIKDYVESWFKEKENLKKFEEKKEEIEKHWKKIHTKFINSTLNILKLKRVKRRNFTCIISINPICPKDLKKNTFSIFYDYGIKDILVIIAHEIFHFYYFDKWEETFPNSNKKTFDGPHIIWYLSEILDPLILNTPKIQKILKRKAPNYKEYEKFKIKGKSLIEYFEYLYEDFDKNKDFGEFLKIAYKEIKKYEKDIQKV